MRVPLSILCKLYLISVLLIVKAHDGKKCIPSRGKKHSRHWPMLVTRFERKRIKSDTFSQVSHNRYKKTNR